jgi:predicted trehalose synthase
MLKPFAVVVACLGTPLCADDLLPRLEAAQEEVDARMLRLMDANPARARWTEERRAKSGCALTELERLRGRATVERYVMEVEKAVDEAATLKRPSEFGGLAARIHGDTGLSLQSDLIPITRKCGVGL